MKRLSAILALALLAAVPARAEQFDLNVSSDSFRAALDGPLSRLFEGSKGAYDLGLLVNHEGDDDAFAAHGAFLLTGNAGAQDADVTAGVGVRAQYLNLEDDNGGGLALGGQVEVRFPGFERFGFSAYGWYQPEVLSLGKVEEQTEWAASVDYKILKDAAIYVGYRELRADIENAGSHTLDEGAHFGLRLNF